ncbi:MAG: hypothetical protein MI921_03230 [Cytophagales bacterium]|nr:hypothetical protein [Cytophagales bacterium]
MIKDYQNIISVICDRFNNTISQFDVVSWLENFDKVDWKKALTVLNAFEYYSTKDIIYEFEQGLNSIIEELEPDEKVCVVPIGNVGKSGAAMVYYLKKTPAFSDKRISILKEYDYTELMNYGKIVIVDDYSGSGGTILEFHDKIKINLPETHSVSALTVAYMDKAKNALDKRNIKLYGNSRIPAFSNRGSVFGYYPKMKVIREFCFKYGDKLYPEVKYKNGKSNHHPLGFSNTQALIGFEHSIPNNTIPIIWADKKRADNKKCWIPIFPRRGELLIKDSKEFKKNQRYWMSIIFKLGINGTLFSEEERYSRHNILLLSVMHLKRKQKGAINICQYLGVNLNEYEQIIRDGQDKDIFDSNEELTEQAINLIEQIRKRAKFQKSTYIKPELMIEEDMLYIPTSFRGNS